MALTADLLDSHSTSSWIYSRWVQPPVQGRSQKTFFRFLDAAEGLLSNRHWHEVSIQEIVKKAEASVGSFYNRFSDKTALLHCLDDRLGQECELTIAQLKHEVELCPALADDAPAILISLLMRLCTERGGVIRALDLARKMAADESYVALGPRFDAALDGFSEYLVSVSDAYKSCEAEAVSRAFRETFTLIRESLLYEGGSFDDAEMHGVMLRHFQASIDI